MHNDLDDRLRALTNFDGAAQPGRVRWRRLAAVGLLAAALAWAGLALFFGIGGL